MSEKKIGGSCLCGQVQFEYSGEVEDFRYCHCERCRKATGGAHNAMVIVKKEQFRWVAGESEVKIFIHKEAEDYPRGFCKNCGGMVPRPARDSRFMAVPAGTLDEDPGIKPRKNIFWKIRAPWFVPTSDLPKFEERG